MRGGLNIVRGSRPASRANAPASFLVGLHRTSTRSCRRPIDDDWRGGSGGEAGTTPASRVIGAGGARLNCAASDNPHERVADAVERLYKRNTEDPAGPPGRRPQSTHRVTRDYKFASNTSILSAGPSVHHGLRTHTTPDARLQTRAQARHTSVPLRTGPFAHRHGANIAPQRAGRNELGRPAPPHGGLALVRDPHNRPARSQMRRPYVSGTIHHRASQIVPDDSVG
jgi:hypothetical protein